MRINQYCYNALQGKKGKAILKINGYGKGGAEMKE